MTGIGYGLFYRPDGWLEGKPLSVRRVYDVIALQVTEENDGVVGLSLSRLMELARLSRRSVLLAVKRLVRGKLLEDLRERVGRGATYVFRVLAFVRARRRWPRVLSGTGPVSFPQKKVHPSPHTPYKETRGSEETLKTRQPSRGALVGQVRRALESSPTVDARRKSVCLSVLGRALFRGKVYGTIASHPELLVRFVEQIRGRLMWEGVPVDRAPRRQVFTRAASVLASLVGQFEAGMGAATPSDLLPLHAEFTRSRYSEEPHGGTSRTDVKASTEAPSSGMFSGTRGRSSRVFTASDRETGVSRSHFVPDSVELDPERRRYLARVALCRWERAPFPDSPAA